LEITLDATAAGYGWFVDPTPSQDSEFRRHLPTGAEMATPSSVAFGHMDLLTVITHEIGHVLGLDHADSVTFNVMGEDLEAGTREVFNFASGPASRTEQKTQTGPSGNKAQPITFFDSLWDDDRTAGTPLRWNASTGDWEEDGEWNRFSPFQRVKPGKDSAWNRISTRLFSKGRPN
jgi:hypothetical protein